MLFLLINDDKDLTSENYPLSILLNDRHDIFMPHSKTKITIGSEGAKWDLTTKELLLIMQNQSTVTPYNVGD